MDTYVNKKIAIIGAGHMGTALIQGFLKSGIHRKNIIVSGRSAGTLNTIKQRYKIAVVTDNKAAVNQADWIIIAVKPFAVFEVLKEIKEVVKQKVLISAAAAVTIESMHTYLGNNNQKIIRIMPNIPISYQQGIVGIFANKKVTKKERKQVVELFSTIGLVIDVKNEKFIDVITVVGGCGPAVAAYFIDLLSQYAIQSGIDQETSKQIALKIFKGTIDYLEKTELSSQQLIKSVATKGGVTESIINAFEKNRIPKQFSESMNNGEILIKSLGKKLNTVTS